MALPDNIPWRISGASNKLNLQIQAVASSLRPFFPQTSKLDILGMFLCSSLPLIVFWHLGRRRTRKSISQGFTDDSFAGKDTDTNGKSFDIPKVRRTNMCLILEAEASDPSLLKKHSVIRSYQTSRFTYPSLRIFFREHPQFEKLPTEPARLPLLVFIHGFGGSVAQFHPLLTSLVNLSSCLSIDLPGCGVSKFAPKDWDAYTMESLVELLGLIIEDYRREDQNVVLIGHSMGCSLSAMLATKSMSFPNSLAEHVVGLVAVCPRAEAPSPDEVSMFRKLLWIPSPIFNVWRNYDKRGGKDSASVSRFVGADADDETKALQYRFNYQSKTPVWRRMASGTLPNYENGVAKGGFPGKDVWAGLEVPVFLVAGEADNITKPGEIQKIASFLGKSHPIQSEMDEASESVVDPAFLVDISTEARSPGPSKAGKSIRPEYFLETNPDTAEEMYEDPSTPNDGLSTVPPQPSKPKKVLKTTILPSPASHALLYQPATVRILAGLISDFLCTQVSPRLSLGWQLQYLSDAGKWDVKNLAKWKAVKPVSEPIDGIFRAMKTLREVDETHSPDVFVKEWGSEITDVVDISHESPVYDPRGLEKGGIQYHKFPTVSKIPPTESEVASFIALIDRIRDEQTKPAYIAVHCHYGFNRTGFFIVCYLKERCGYTLPAAISEFAEKRPKGIRHAHFLDTLFVRYCVGLKRAPTL
ncbi:mRNA-capping enzyme [Lachnellula hyalina]|uniref:mRNA-capping enzyme n=1 Tax=Lachnellula hyalina TaxID=1316788 RepID=A0A8H8U0K1_9HELO|nr:mRNA-capping enzyme [Lachnellula hyalina]TVY29395.1 mRNA-capping enzyme [Lachnellula hyalina]